MKITRVHHQRIKVFVLPEMLTQRKPPLNVEKWADYLQDRLAHYRGIKLGGFNLSPAFDYSRDGSYEERFWSMFRGIGSKAFPLHFPFKIQFKNPEFTPILPEFGILSHKIRVRGRLYPYGAVCLRISEYLEPAKPMTPEQVIQFFNAKLLHGGLLPISRDGILGNLKDSILNAFDLFYNLIESLIR